MNRRCVFATIICSLLLPLTAALSESGGGSQRFNSPPEVWLEAPTVPLLPGTSFTLNMGVGSNLDPVVSLFGLSFELHYSDDRYIEFPDSVQASAGPFLQPDTYTFTRHEPENNVFYLAVSRKRGAPGQSGYGLVLSLPLRIKENAPEGWETCFDIRSTSANDSVGVSIPVQPGVPLCLTVIEPKIEIIPNPFTPNGDDSNDEVEFKRDGGIPVDWVILIMDRAGRVIKRLRNGDHFWNGRDEDGRSMLPGTYLYTISDRKQIVKRGLLYLIL